MKAKIKKFFIIIFILCIVGTYAYYKFYEINNPLNYITVFQSGVYQNSVNAYAEASKNKGIVIKDDDLYRVYIAAYQNDSIIEKMNDYYKKKGIDCRLKQIKVDESYIKLLNKYESMLTISSDESIIPNINNYLITSLESHIWL